MFGFELIGLRLTVRFAVPSHFAGSAVAAADSGSNFRCAFAQTLSAISKNIQQ
jgi:hypothetical protein